MWVDSNYTKLAEADVQSPDNIKFKTYDRIIIAVEKVELQREIEAKLNNIGVPRYKILKIGQVRRDYCET